MGIESLELADDLHVVLVRGTLGVAEMRRTRVRLEHAAARAPGLRVLVVLRDFTGWERSPGWSALDDLVVPDQHLRRIAVVGEPQWREQSLLFMASELRAVPIEFFATPALDDALRWLASA